MLEVSSERGRRPLVRGAKRSSPTSDEDNCGSRGD